MKTPPDIIFENKAIIWKL